MSSQPGPGHPDNQPRTLVDKHTCRNGRVVIGPARAAEHFVHGLDGPVVVVDGAVCVLLDRLLRLGQLRSQVRGQNAALDQALLAIHTAALATQSCGSATNFVQEPQPATQLEHDTLSTGAAAEVIGVTSAAVRKAIAEKRLPATQVDGRWRITRDDLAAYMAARA
jgi:excisionase family DNA binding protein